MITHSFNDKLQTTSMISIKCYLKYYSFQKFSRYVLLTYSVVVSTINFRVFVFSLSASKVRKAQRSKTHLPNWETVTIHVTRYYHFTFCVSHSNVFYLANKKNSVYYWRLRNRRIFRKLNYLIIFYIGTIVWPIVLRKGSSLST